MVFERIRNSTPGYLLLLLAKLFVRLSSYEFFTHVSPIAILVIGLPVVPYFLPKFGGEGSPFFLLLVGILAGVFLWTFAGYILHCFLFHFPAKPKWEERLAFLFHGIHHEQPRVKTRLMMPMAVSIPLALFFWFLLPGFWPRASFFRLNFTHFCRIYLGLFPV